MVDYLHPRSASSASDKHSVHLMAQVSMRREPEKPERAHTGACIGAVSREIYCMKNLIGHTGDTIKSLHDWLNIPLVINLVKIVIMLFVKHRVST